MYGLKTLRVTVCKSRFSLKGDAAEDMIFVPIDKALGERRDSVRVEAEIEWARTRAPPGRRLGTFLSLFGVCAWEGHCADKAIVEPMRGRWVNGKLEWRTVRDDKVVDEEVVLDDLDLAF